MIDWKVFPYRESRPEARIIVRDAEGEAWYVSRQDMARYTSRKYEKVFPGGLDLRALAEDFAERFEFPDEAEDEEEVRILATIEDRDGGGKYRFAFGNKPADWFDWTLPARRKGEGKTLSRKPAGGGRPPKESSLPAPSRGCD